MTTSRAYDAHTARTVREISTNEVLNTCRIKLPKIRWVGVLAAGCVIRYHPYRPACDWTIAYSDCPELRGLRVGEYDKLIRIKAIAAPKLPPKWEKDR